MNYTNDITSKVLEIKTQVYNQALTLVARLESTPQETLIHIANTSGKISSPVTQLQPGQILSAQVTTQPEQNQINLQLGKINLQIPITDLEGIKQEALLQQLALLNTGKGTTGTLRLLIEVLRTQPTLELRIQTPPASPPAAQQTAATNNSSTSPADNAIRNLIATQRGLAPLLANLVQLAKTNATQPLPQTVLKEARALMENIATSARAGTAEGVQRAIQNSGTFLEAKIANANPVSSQLLHPSALASALQADFKGSLLRFQQALSSLYPTSSSGAQTAAQPLTGQATASPSAPLANLPTPPLRGGHPEPQAAAKASIEMLSGLRQLQEELLTQTDASLSRIRLGQVANVPDGDQRQLWMLELPIKHENRVDIFQIRLEQERSQNKDEDAEHTWTIHLAFDLQELGPVHAQVRLLKSQISTIFWADHSDTVALINQQSTQLINALQQEGLQVNNVACQQGSPPRNSAALRSKTILDEKA